jgi:hypothetical protein
MPGVKAARCPCDIGSQPCDPSYGVFQRIHLSFGRLALWLMVATSKMWLGVLTKRRVANTWKSSLLTNLHFCAIEPNVNCRHQDSSVQRSEMFNSCVMDRQSDLWIISSLSPRARSAPNVGFLLQNIEASLKIQNHSSHCLRSDYMN